MPKSRSSEYIVGPIPENTAQDLVSIRILWQWDRSKKIMSLAGTLANFSGSWSKNIKPNDAPHHHGEIGCTSSTCFTV